MIQSQEVLDNGSLWFEMSCGSRAIQIYVAKSYASFCVANASHAVWRGAGRVFHGDDKFDRAEASYKCGKVKSMIVIAKQLAAEMVAQA
jgi:hypothetical protein